MKRQKSAGDDRSTLTLKLMGRVIRSPKQRAPVAPQNGPQSNKNLKEKKRIKVNLQKRPTPCPFYANVYRLMFECFLAQYRDYSPVANYCIADVVITEAGWENDFISELPP